MNFPQLAAIGFLALLTIAPFVALVIAMARSRLNPLQFLLWAGAYVLCKFLWRTEWPDRLHLLEGKGAVVVCNHRSSVDPFFVQTATGRKVHWMVAREFCEHWIFGLFLRACEVIPVSRGGVDTAATKAAIRMTSRGDLIGMLPEGRINMTDALLLPARPGAALVALKARVPVVPCFIEGAPFRRYPWSPFFMRAKVIVRFGEPIDLSEYYDRQQEPGIVQEIMRRILKAMAELAGQPDFEPQLAGRQWKPTKEEVDSAIDAQERREAGGG